ncbi:DUF2269 family protein [Actinokineospora cianjurensis]|uniref:Putative integral membrane protein DUF2269 n=1 Tax=Actinokineospora cianjurensis TaxID=585224 RepID=A0A421B0V6_9PSEU|nr:DUF2269 family protein [Actinokineospora cianjurensis]RLK57968.1 putative integral membrane protein DUF2269 [Actinokineospora cianjurensis]
MTALLLSIHVLASIVAIGPITVAASMFPRSVKPGSDPATAALLHRVCRGYTVVGVAVPVFGIATGAAMGVLGQPWLSVSMLLTALAAALLLLAILPGQKRLLDAAEATREATTRLTMTTGLFNLVWATVVVLMITRPGSTTGV